MNIMFQALKSSNSLIDNNDRVQNHRGIQLDTLQFLKKAKIVPQIQIEDQKDKMFAIEYLDKN